MTNPERRSADSIVRFVNALIAALVACFFLAHTCLGSLSFVIGDLSNGVPWLVWGFFYLVLAHVALCLVTSVFMLTDKVRPPSGKKKAHLALKWASGLLLLLVIGEHISAVTGISASTGTQTLFSWLEPSKALIALLVVVAAFLCWHTFVGVKSLVRDLNISKRLRTPIRVVSIALTIVAGIILLVALFTS